jgi:hypothetical protein
MSYHAAKLKCLLSATFLAVASEAVLWITRSRYGKMIDNDEWNTLGTLTFTFHIPGQIVRELLFPSYPGSDRYGIPLILTSGAIQFFVVYWCFLMVGIYIWLARRPTSAVEATAG